MYNELILAKLSGLPHNNSCPKGTEKKEPNGGSLASRGRKGLAHGYHSHQVSVHRLPDVCHPCQRRHQGRDR
nr:MAG TPA: hypothetical protein [Caudoviricetes sp.]